MGNLFGKPEPSPSHRTPAATTSTITSHDRCVLQLKKERDKLKKAQRVFEGKGERDRDTAVLFLKEEAKAKAAGDTWKAKLNRDKALYCLKRRKAQERHIERTFGLLQNIETMIHEVDARQLDTEVAEALRAATGELKAINDHLSLDEVAEIMDSAQEQIRITEEVSELLSQNLTFQDEALLEDELNDLMEPKTATKQQNPVAGEVLEGVQVPGHELPTNNPTLEESPQKEGRTAVAL